ncbi:leucyl/phenylalanyl-tRNA--protein transferase [Sphingobacterium thalpophilum]|uniref:Leucyl/phenylalanyl-tRNA--protein transferase n=1 Tax=Sphingobacterium thalpophilum TaxID=259 RepID=A0A4U9UK17_9SPHI|nr:MULTISPECIES: leucyl/phenylalanyl-tRNA--protein transferase [Sphingobacterium]MCW8310209.1 leucyl/phenylalanyl-tRNA--protein transferase [Sphingobacterium sp. InxBP1]VTR32092.1 Leucyl/phenylalanyl-tRNA--protein transferase [Sphingobacterium thalpophilum]
MVFELDSKRLEFPHPSYAEEDGLLAIGGDLSAERLLLAYSNGIFPWFSDETPILWYAPDPRFVIYPDKIKISKSMASLMRKNIFSITIDQHFGQVIQHCASIQRKGQHGTWITRDMMEAYTLLFEKGYAHSIEVWKESSLVGGLYGVLINGVFCGESMFSKEANASKAALIYLAQEIELKLIDCQFHTPHLASMGGEFLSLSNYLTILTTDQ